MVTFDTFSIISYVHKAMITKATIIEIIDEVNNANQ